MRLMGMQSVAKAIDKINTGYNQGRRWSFLDREARQLRPNNEADCSSACAAIAYLAGYLPKPDTNFHTGNAQRYFEEAGWTSRPFKGLNDLHAGEMVLNTKSHIEFMYDDNTMFSANLDENGQATGGVPGDQTGKEVYFKPKYVYVGGWNVVLSPPKKPQYKVGYTIGTNYNPGGFSVVYIKEIQALLGLEPDGIAGPDTFAAVKAFQKSNGLVEDGVPGPMTVSALKGTAVRYQGVLMTPGTLHYFKQMAAAFKRATGLDLLITSGYRTYAEQADIYRRWKNGTFKAPSVAPPGTSLHESGRALDLRDSGRTPGVTSAGNSRSNWLRANAPKYGFNPTGYGFREPWHYELRAGLDPWRAPGASGGGATYSKAYIKDIQNRLNRVNGAKLVADGVKGKATDAAIKAFQKKHGLVQDALPGVATLKKLKTVEVQRAVRANADGIYGADSKKRVDAVRKASRWGGSKFPYGVKYTQQVVGVVADGVWGANSAKAHDRAVRAIQTGVGVKADGIWGSMTDTETRKL